MPRDFRNNQADAWFEQITAQPAQFPFAFCYEGKRFTGFAPEAFETLERKSWSERDVQTVTFCFRPDDALCVTLVCRHYPLYGASEWTVWFENRGTRDTGVLSDAESVLRFGGDHPLLKGILGDHVNWYRPYTLDVEAAPRYFESNSGRATHVNFPYFNLEYGDGGVMLAIGWAGTWRADFCYDRSANETEARLRSVNKLHTRLKPGEKIRTALFAVLPYAVRNEYYATNCWRSWFVRHNLPKADSKNTEMRPFSTCCLAGDTGLPNSDGSISERFSTWRPSLEKMIAEDVKVDFRWFDAGWYVAPDLTSPENDWWGTVGTWTLDEKKWPGDTFRESTDYARSHGMKTLMWFEPERVTDPESLARNFGYNPAWAIRREGVRAISNNIGDTACFAWTLERIQKTLRDNRVEMYREDNNSDQAGLWKDLDAREGEDRSGITECKFIDAHYRMWDALIDTTLSYGGCGFVDSCASGGGRNDLESLRRGIPLMRSDYDRTTTGMRLSMTTAFNCWVPFCGASCKESTGQLEAGTVDPYVWRASYLPVLNVVSQFTQDPDQDFGPLRFGMKEWQRMNGYLLKEFYVLTPWHTEQETTGFTAYAFFAPEDQTGVLLAFRQEKCEEDTLTLSLPFAEGADCLLTDEDSGESLPVSAGEAARGFALRFSHPRCARLLWIRRLHAEG